MPPDTKPPRPTWQKKVFCPKCGYNCRITQKWLAVGIPKCPVRGHGVMQVDETPIRHRSEYTKNIVIAAE